MFNKINEAFDLNVYLLNLYSRRQELLASNIANIETPNYTPSDINFFETFQKLTKKKTCQPISNLYITSAKHIPISDSKKLNNNNEIIDKDYIIRKNKTDIDTEKVNFIKNSLLYQMNIVILNSKFKNIMNVLKG
ncbi:MAG: flagellar basal body rod protein FlgB [Buchnera aphidicola (Schlechtendalia peitan)]